MKTIVLTIVLALLIQLGYGQQLIESQKMYSTTESMTKDNVKHFDHNKNQPETLFNNQQSFGGYVGFSMGYGILDGQSALVTSGRVMVVANHYLGMGFGGKGFVTNPTETPYAVANDPNVNTLYVSKTGGYGGFYVEPVLLSMKPIHLSFPILLGAGAIAEAKWDNTIWDADYDYESSQIVSSAFFVIEPGIELEFNIAKWFRIGLGASYILTSDINGLTENGAEPMQGFNYGMSFKMGWF